MSHLQGKHVNRDFVCLDHCLFVVLYSKYAVKWDLGLLGSVAFIHKVMVKLLH